MTSTAVMKILSATVWNSAQGDRFHFLWLLTLCCSWFASVPRSCIIAFGLLQVFFFAWMAIAAIRLSHWPDGNIDWLDHPWCSDVLLVKGTKLQHLGILVVKLPSRSNDCDVFCELQPLKCEISFEAMGVGIGAYGAYLLARRGLPKACGCKGFFPGWDLRWGTLCWANVPFDSGILFKKTHCKRSNTVVLILSVFVLRFLFLFCSVFRFGVSHIPPFRKKWRHRFLGKVDLWKRLGQASCSRKVLGRPACNHERLKNPQSAGKGLFLTAMVRWRDVYCNSVHVHTIFDKKWMKVILLKIARGI